MCPDFPSPIVRIPTIAPAGDSYIVVAAADTPTKLKSRADYICDGIDDQEEINKALTVADIVILCQGTYWVSGSIIMGSNKSLLGGGSRCTIKVMDYADGFSIIINSDRTNGNSNLLISQIHIDGNRSKQFNFHTGIYFENVMDSKITCCHIEKLRDTGICLASSNNNVIASNICKGNGGVGIYLASSNNNVITGNIFNGNDAIGVRIYLSNNNVITGNTCNENGSIGIFLGFSSDNTIAGNTFNGNSYGQFLSLSSNNNTIVGNTYNGNRSDGILMFACHNNTIAGNTFNGNSKGSPNVFSGITLIDSDFNLISGNIFRHGGYQKYGINIANSYCDYNMIEGNSLCGSGLTGDIYDAGTNTRKRDNLGNDGVWLIDV